MAEDDMPVMLFRVIFMLTGIFLSIFIFKISTTSDFNAHHGSFQTTFFMVMDTVAPNGQLDNVAFESVYFEDYPSSQSWAFELQLTDLQGNAVGEPVYYNEEYHHTRAELGHIGDTYKTFEGTYPVQYKEGDMKLQGMIRYSFVHVGD